MQTMSESFDELIPLVGEGVFRVCAARPRSTIERGR